MTWNYSGDPSASALDEVRFLMGDTNTNDQQLTDGELNYLIEESGSNIAAAIKAAESLAAKYARSTSKSIGGVSLSYSERAGKYQALAASLRRRLAMTAKPYAGGISAADKDANAQDADSAIGSFRKGMHDIHLGQEESEWNPNS